MKIFFNKINKIICPQKKYSLIITELPSSPLTHCDPPAVPLIKDSNVTQQTPDPPFLMRRPVSRTALLVSETSHFRRKMGNFRPSPCCGWGGQRWGGVQNLSQSKEDFQLQV